MNYTNSMLLDPANWNSVNLNSPLFQTKNDFPWICVIIFYHLFLSLAILNYFSFPSKVQTAGFNSMLLALL